MIKLLWHSFRLTLTILGVVFTIIPEDSVSKSNLCTSFSEEWNIVINRILFVLIILISVICIYLIYVKFRFYITIKGNNYTIKIEYKDLFQCKNCRIVIPFDECYTTNVGEEPYEIKSSSICGQFLNENPNLNIIELIKKHNIQALSLPSDYNNQTCYKSGILIPYNKDYLLMAFSKLDKNGLARMTRDNYLNSLSNLWLEIDKYYAQHDVVIPILGSGITRFNGESLTQQQLLDLIIASYQLSVHKIKNPNKLRIVCKRRGDFSLNKIGSTL